MFRRMFALGAIAFALCGARFPDAGAARGTVRGTVTDAADGQPIANANVVVKGTTFGSVTNDQGGYIITGVPEGTQTIEVTRIGYSVADIQVTVPAGGVATVNASLKVTAVALEGVTVRSASRHAEKITDAPATVDVIRARQIDQFPSLNFGEMLAREKGIDFVRTGVEGTGFNVRGFNSAFNPQNLQMTDGRLSTLVATGLPFGALSTVVKDDIERVEVVLGPTAALYGPNANNGLINTITKDPRTSQGTMFALGGGNQSVFDGRFRRAQVINDKVAYKVTAEYEKGTNFNYTDTVYIGSGASATAMPELDLNRNFNSLHGEAAVYVTPKKNHDIIFTYGGSKNNMLAPTNAGRNQIKNWILNIFQARYVSPRLFAQAYLTLSSTDSTYAINQRTQNYASFLAAGFSDAVARQRSFTEAWAGPMNGGVALPRDAIFKDASKRVNAEVQYNNTFGHVEVTLGGQFQRDMANSRGTYLLDQNGPIDMNQIGGYGQIETPLGDSGFRLVLAARGDNHDLYGFNFIPKGGVLYSSHAGTWRLTYGQGIAAPTILNLSMDIFGGLALGNGEGFTLTDGTKIAPLKVETLQTFEAGYKGVIRQRLYVDVSLYHNSTKNFISPLINIAPNAFSGGALVAKRGNVDISQYQSGLVVGPGDYVLTNVNFGKVQTYGLDLGLNYYLSDKTNLALNYSWFGYSLDKNDPANDGNRDGKVENTDLPINTPTNKVSLAVNTNQKKWFGSVFARWVQAYDFFSGINVAAHTNSSLVYGGSPVIEGQRVGRDFNYGPLDGKATMDLSLGYHVTPQLTIAGHVTNLFNAQVRQFVASPVIGRLVSVETKVQFH